jgi:hypothetical protein
MSGAAHGAGLAPIPAQAMKVMKAIKDPNKPKQNKTSFNYYAIDARQRAKVRNAAQIKK